MNIDGLLCPDCDHIRPCPCPRTPEAFAATCAAADQRIAWARESAAKKDEWAQLLEAARRPLTVDDLR